MASPGQRLRMLRESLHLTLRDVAGSSMKIALDHGQQDFAMPFIRLFRIESKGALPSIYGLYSLSVIYRSHFKELLGWYGINLDAIPADLKFGNVPVTHRIENDLSAEMVWPEVSTDRAVNMELTSSMRRSGASHFSLLEAPAKDGFVYAYVGNEDYTMYPLIRPGSFLQIDESRSRIESFGWRSEHERPIYFVETRPDGYRVGWCSMSGRDLIIESHPLSATKIKSYCHPQDAEIVGRVVAVSMRLINHEKAPVQFAQGRGKAASPVMLSTRRSGT